MTCRATSGSVRILGGQMPRRSVTIPDMIDRKGDAALIR